MKKANNFQILKVQSQGIMVVLKLRKKIFLKKYFLQNIHYLLKKCFHKEKKFYIENFFYWKKTFFTEKDINENVYIYIYHLRNVFLCRKCLCYKYKSFLNIHSFCKKNCCYHKKCLLKLRCELNNLVLKLSEAPSRWYSLN